MKTNVQNTTDCIFNYWLLFFFLTLIRSKFQVLGPIEVFNKFDMLGHLTLCYATSNIGKCSYIHQLD